MKDTGKYDISCLGEFVDKNLEREFFNYYLRRYANFIGPVTLVFGFVYFLFIIFDYYAIGYTFSFITISIIRAIVLVASVAMFLLINKIKNYSSLIFLVTVYEITAIASFLIIIFLYESLTFLSFFSIVAIVFAIYLMPNKLIYAFLLSAFLILAFFITSAKNIENIGRNELIQIIGYITIFITYCSIGAYMNNFYKRKQFADSKELIRVSVTDSLTGINNRMKFSRELIRRIDFCNKNDRKLCLIIFDIDDFKSVNDNHGHLIGDSVIQNTASVIKKSIRSTDIFARWGGEEFVLLLPDTGIDKALEMAERMRACIQDNKYNISENVTCSFGVVQLRKDEEDGSLMQRADNLLYIAKDKGKNVVVCENNTF